MRVVPFTAMLLAHGVIAASADDGAKVPAPSITVQGESSAEVVPDSVLLVFGVVTDRPAAADAMTDNSKAVADAIAVIKAEGVKPEDIATTSAGLTPETSQPGKGAPKIIGYRAENQLKVRLRPADRAGAIIGKLVDNGVNDVESVSALVSDNDALRDRLKAEAARNARRQAEIYAGALELKLGPVLRIDPEPAVGIAPFAVARKYASAPAPVPVELGQQTVTEAVRVTFSLLPN